MEYKFVDFNGELRFLETERACSVCLVFIKPDGTTTYTASKTEKSAKALASEYSRLIWIPKNDFSKAAQKARKENADYAEACSWHVVPLEQV